MIPRRNIDDLHLLSDLSRRVCTWIVCLGCLWTFDPVVGLAAEPYPSSLAADAAPIHDSETEPFTIRWKSRPWFLQQTADSTNSSDFVQSPVIGSEFQRSPRSSSSRSIGRCPPVFDGYPSDLPRPYCHGPQGSHDLNARFCQDCPIHGAGRLCFYDDVATLPMRWGTDVCALATCENAIFLGTFAAGAVVLRNNVDSQVAQNIQEHGPYWGNFSHALGSGSESFVVQIPLIAGIYGAGLYYQDEDLHELGLTMFAAFKFSVIGSLALQYATGTHRSDGGLFNAFGDSGFPATPVATGFALAAVIDERYGWRGGVPAYLTAGLIGWSEIDQNQHKVSEVVFGAALGYAIGKSLGSLHYRPGSGSPFKLVPFFDAWNGAQGIGVERRY
jgi:hypothetical protein